jgi:hypothetical protein
MTDKPTTVGEMTYKTLFAYLASLSCCFPSEGDMANILEKMAKVHIEHNIRFNAEYNKICEERKKNLEVVEFETTETGCFSDISCYFNDVFEDVVNDWLYITYRSDEKSHSFVGY